MARPTRAIDGQAVRALARYAGLPLPEDRVERQAELVERLVLPVVQAWEREKLGFWFENGRFTFVRPVLVDRLRRPRL